MTYETTRRRDALGERERRPDPYPPPTGRPGWGRWLTAALGVLLLAVAALALWLWLDDDGSAGPEIGIGLSDVADDPAQYMGERVIVSGEVTAIPMSGQPAFTMGDSDVHVVSANLPEQVGEGDVLQVTGIVRTFAVADVEDELGIDLADDGWADWDQQAVIVAEDLQLAAERSAGPEQGVTLSQLAEDPAQFLGQQVTVSGQIAEMDPELGDQGFTIGEEEIRVFAASLPEGVDEHDVIEVTGTVRPFELAAFEQDYDVGVEDPEVWDGWLGQPVIDASSVSLVHQIGD